MKFSIRYSDQIVGLLVLVGLVILVFVIFMLGTSQRWFKRDIHYVTYFTSASGLSKNMPVQYRGFTIGNVKKISLAEDNSVEVIFSIFEEHTQRVREGSLVEVQGSPIGLGSSFIFHQGLGEELLFEGMIIPRFGSEEARKLEAMGLTGRPEHSGDNIDAILTQVNTLLEIINVSLGGSEGEETALSQLLSHINNLLDEIASNISPILDNVESLTDKIVDPSGTVMSILDAQGTLYSSLEKAIASISGIIISLEKTAEFLPSQLPQISVLISNLNETINTVDDVLIAISNNPLLKGGVPQRRESGPGGASPRNMDF